MSKLSLKGYQFGLIPINSIDWYFDEYDRDQVEIHLRGEMPSFQFNTTGVLTPIYDATPWCRRYNMAGAIFGHFGPPKWLFKYFYWHVDWNKSSIPRNGLLYTPKETTPPTSRPYFDSGYVAYYTF